MISIYNEEVRNTASDMVVEESSIANIPAELIADYTQIITSKVDNILEAQKEAAKENEEEETEAPTRYSILKSQMEADEYVGTAEDYIKWYAESNAKQYLVYKKIAELENITVSDDELAVSPFAVTCIIEALTDGTPLHGEVVVVVKRSHLVNAP